MGRRFAQRAAAGWAAIAATAIAVASQATPRVDPELVRLLTPSAGRHPLADSSGRLPVVVELPPGVDASSWGLRAIAPGLATARVAPADLRTFVARHPGVRFSVSPPFHTVLDESIKLNRTLAYRAAVAAAGSGIAGTGKGVVVGIVDSGLDVTHPDFRDAAGHTRVAWLLDFSRGPLGKHVDMEEAFGCAAPQQTPCAVLDANDIDAALSGAADAYLPHDTLGHGTHVTSIAAGNGGAGARFVGGAPDATLIVANVVASPAGTSSDADIATGVAFVFDLAANMGLPAVANLSLGSDYGPHDGTTALEQALAAMVGPVFPGRALVLAAGNSGALYSLDRPDQRLGVHTQSRVTGGVPAQAGIEGFTDDGTDTMSGSVHVWISYGGRDSLSIGFDGPDGLSIAPVPIGATGGAASTDGALHAAIFNGAVDPEGDLVGGTHGAIVIFDGHWSREDRFAIRFEGEGFVDAWVDVRPDGMSSNFAELFEVATREGTINVPATHPDLIAVGCTVNRTRWADADSFEHDTSTIPALSLLADADGTCYFGSAGPTATGVRKPEISAPGALVAAAMSVDAAPGRGVASLFDPSPGVCAQGNECMVVDAGHAVLSGSSMSAPQVTGAVALLLERDPSLTQPEILTLLRQGARRPAGKVGADYQLGVGALDVVGTMAAFDARATSIARDPDARASWMSLSDAYAKPDLDFSVTGTVQVRSREGAIADGFDPARISLSVSDDGMVSRPLARVAAGLWEFELRAAPRSGGSAMTIDARIDGVPIGDPDSRLSGHRSLPIGADRWIALGTTRAYGGCSFAESARGRDAIWIALFAFACALGRRRNGDHVRMRLVRRDVGVERIVEPQIPEVDTDHRDAGKPIERVEIPLG